MKYIATSVTREYWNPQTTDWLDSVRRHAPEYVPIVFAIDFEPEYDCTIISIQGPSIETYRKGWCDNRDNYVCLEGGEFTGFFFFDDNDIIIFSDADMVMQRPFSGEEATYLDSILGGWLVGAAYDNSPPRPLHRDGYLATEQIKSVFPPVLGEYLTFNCGLMVASGISWKMLNSVYRRLYPYIREMPPKHHALGQWLISYLLQYPGCPIDSKPMPPGLHEAPWWDGNMLTKKNGAYYKDGEKVCFLHHKGKF